MFNTVYRGPKDDRLIDKYLLTRALQHIDAALQQPANLYCLGGTALTLLEIRDGSEDIDIAGDETWSALHAALQVAIKNIDQGNVGIAIEKNGKTEKYYAFPHNGHFQFFGSPSGKGIHLTEGKMLPNDFIAYAHKMKVLPWVMPEGGKMVEMPATMLFSHLNVYVLGPVDLACAKIFGTRQKDVTDVGNLVEAKRRFFRKYPLSVKKRVIEYFKLNSVISANIRIGAMRIHNGLVKKYPDVFLPIENLEDIAGVKDPEKKK